VPGDGRVARRYGLWIDELSKGIPGGMWLERGEGGWVVVWATERELK
jgi:hypothetical protein